MGVPIMDGHSFSHANSLGRRHELTIPSGAKVSPPNISYGHRWTRRLKKNISTTYRPDGRRKREISTRQGTWPILLSHFPTLCCYTTLLDCIRCSWAQLTPSRFWWRIDCTTQNFELVPRSRGKIKLRVPMMGTLFARQDHHQPVEISKFRVVQNFRRRILRGYSMPPELLHLYPLREKSDKKVNFPKFA
jgi:hypothetical protein